jgi:hypothetical protein
LVFEKYAVRALPFRSIRSLCSLALAEGEGVGTAYEYFVKRSVLDPWLARLPQCNKLLVAGLPEKFGYSLDLLLVAQELNIADVAVIDERPSALDGFRQSLVVAQTKNELTQVQPRFLLATEIEQMNEVKDSFDLCLTFGVIQRLEGRRRCDYVKRIAELAANCAVFAPNGDHSSYENLGMNAPSLADFRELVGLAGTLDGSGYVDIPPWPPGLKQSEAQRHRFAHQSQKRRSHNMYAFVRRQSAARSYAK